MEGGKLCYWYLWNNLSKDNDGHGGSDDRYEAGGQGVEEDGQGVVDQHVTLKDRDILLFRFHEFERNNIQHNDD